MRIRSRSHTPHDLLYAFPGAAGEQPSSENLLSLLGTAPTLPPNRATGGLTLFGRSTLAFRSRQQFRTEVKSRCPLRPGVYIMLDRHNQALYVGKSKLLRDRLLSHLRAKSFGQKGARIFAHTHTLIWEELPDEFGCLLREVELIELLRPRFNVRDNPNRKKLGYLLLGREPAPHFFLSKHRSPDAEVSAGPFFLSRKLRQAAVALNDLFQLRECPTRSTPIVFSEGDKTPPLTPHCHRMAVKRCLAPCAARCTKEEYSVAVERARGVFSGEGFEFLQPLRDSLETLIQATAFESAALVHEEILLLEWFFEIIRLSHLRKNKLSFVYVVPGEESTSHWYVIRHGKVLRTLRAPRTPAEAAQAGSFLRAIKTSQELSATENVTLASSWFRKNPGERERTLSFRDAIRECKRIVDRGSEGGGAEREA